MADHRAAVLVFAPGADADLDGRVLGGSAEPWPAERREALDWLTLCRFLGWSAAVERADFAALLADEVGCGILVCEPGEVDEQRASALEARLTSAPVLLVAPLAPAGSPLARLAGAAGGDARSAAGEPRWVGPEPHTWSSRLDVEASAVDVAGGAEVWAFCGGAPLIVGRRIGDGAIATLTAHPSELRDAGPSGTGVLRQLLTRAVPGGPDPLDLEGTVVLRMDDPGAAINVHLRSWLHRELAAADWEAIATELTSREARMSACYVPGWIDDGDAGRGDLLVAGESVERRPGAVHPSPLVRYSARSADGPDDYEAEAQALAAFRDAGAGEVEQHGYTHVRAPYEDWASAPDRYENVGWYRELEHFGENGAADPVAAGRAILEKHLGGAPSAFTCPGQACTDAAAELVLEAGFELIAADALAIRDGDRFLWSHHVPGAGLDFPVDWLFEAGLPVVASLHDRDVALNGAGWVGRWLDEWGEVGAKRFIDFRELARELA